MKITVDSEIQGKTGGKINLTQVTLVECVEIASRFFSLLDLSIVESFEIVKITFHYGRSNLIFAHFLIILNFLKEDFHGLGKIETTASLDLQERKSLWFEGKVEGKAAEVGFKIILEDGGNHGVALGLKKGLAKITLNRARLIKALANDLEERGRKTE
ncbi:MAG: hypothetical protein PHZ04_05090 [Patescibacteria group bacterium]|nr:hypothetical protein [Patescibacteria group bacterium]MDD5294915.1 hypothetical protein [Patescibacteria group bacterium]MDD5554088.1 hypothetical protein [Patescibacteria group bacterium]